MNARIKILAYSSEQDPRGGSSAVESDSWDLWAEGKTGSGSVGNGEEQPKWSYAYQFIVRYYKSKPVLDTHIIQHLGMKYKINNIKLDQVSKTFYQIITCDRLS